MELPLEICLMNHDYLMLDLNLEVYVNNCLSAIQNHFCLDVD